VVLGIKLSKINLVVVAGLLVRSGTRVVEIAKTSFSGEGERDAGIVVGNGVSL